MLPVIAIVGRPNVGKSTLFNRLTKSRDAIVANMPGLTRDRQYGEGKLGSSNYLVVDTGGIGDTTAGIDDLMSNQSLMAAEEADIVLFVVDAKAGLTPVDEEIAQRLRALSKTIHVVVNKIDNMDERIASSEFYQLGFEKPFTIAAVHGRGVRNLIDDVLGTLESDEASDAQTVEPPGLKVAIVGRPNVGKSTLVNRILGEERVVVFDMPGTTRDSLSIPLERGDKQYTLIDTAGVRRRAKVTESVEKFSVIKTLQAIESSNVCLMLLNAREGISEQDLHLLGFIIDSGKALVLAVNKWDGLSEEDKQSCREQIERRLKFVDFAPMRFISALHGSGVGKLFEPIEKVYASATKQVSTTRLTEVLHDATQAHPPPMVHGRRIKLRMAHMGGLNPPVFVIHGNQTQALPESYQRYLINTFRKVFKFTGTPIRLELKSGKNPYEHKKNKLTPRQIHKKKRLIKHIRKKK